MALITDKKHLQSFIESVNGWIHVPGKKLYDKKNIQKSDIPELLEKVNEALTPEKLTCNFLLTGKTLKLKETYLKGAKAELEKM